MNPEAARPVRSVRRGRKGFLFATLAALSAFAVYLPALDCGFVNWDDPLYVLRNVRIRSIDLTFLKWLTAAVVAGNWHPLTVLSLAVDHALWALNPPGYHLTNVVLHALDTALVFAVTAELLRRASPESSEDGTLIGGFVAALFFGLHPVHVESVAWVSERKDVLSAFFFLLGVLFYLRYRDPLSRRRAFYYSISLASAVLALMSKPMAVSLPLVLLIVDFYPLDRFGKGAPWKVFAEKIPFLIPAAALSVLTYGLQQQSGAIASSGGLNERLVAVAEAYAFYLYRMVLPFKFAPLYPADLGPLFSGLPFAVFLLVFTGAILFATLRPGGLKPFAALSLYYLVTLLPVAGLVKVGRQGAADRYAYLPGLAVLLFAGAGARLLYERAPGLRPLVAVAVLSVAPLLFWKTLSQTAIWKDSVSLWSAEIDFLKDFPDGKMSRAVAYYNRGLAYYSSGLDGPAIEDFSRVIALDPGQVSAYVNRGSAYARKREHEKAIRDFSIAIRLDPSKAKAYYNRGLVYRDLGDEAKAREDFLMARALGATPGGGP